MGGWPRVSAYRIRPSFAQSSSTSKHSQTAANVMIAGAPSTHRSAACRWRAIKGRSFGSQFSRLAVRISMSPQSDRQMPYSSSLFSGANSSLMTLSSAVSPVAPISLPL